MVLNCCAYRPIIFGAAAAVSSNVGELFPVNGGMYGVIEHLVITPYHAQARMGAVGAKSHAAPALPFHLGEAGHGCSDPRCERPRWVPFGPVDPGDVGTPGSSSSTRMSHPAAAASSMIRGTSSSSA